MVQKILVFTGRLLRNRNVILMLAIVAGLAIGKPAATKTEPLVLPLLALVMTLSSLNVTSRQFASIKNLIRFTVYSLLLNYLILGGLIILLSKWIIHDTELWTGFIMIAIVPPAPAVIPFSYALGGDVLFSLIGITGTYLAALIIMPLAMIYLLGAQSFDPVQLLIILIELVLVPIVISRVLLYFKLNRYIERWRSIAVNWSFFIVIFTLIGLNREAFISDFGGLIRISLIGIAISFGLAYLIELGAKTLHLKSETTISAILMGTTKNYALAGGLLLSLYSERSAIPPAICVFFGILLVVWLGVHFHKSG